MKNKAKQVCQKYLHAMDLMAAEKRFNIKRFVEYNDLSLSTVFFQILKREKLIHKIENTKPSYHQWNRNVIPTRQLAEAVLVEVNKYITKSNKAANKTIPTASKVQNITLEEALNTLANDENYTYEIYRTPKNINKERVL